jgi:quercetin dioxygenase-like cupin family protein
MIRITWTALLLTSFVTLLVASAADATGEPAGTTRERALGAGDERLAWNPCPPLFPPGCQIAVLHGDPSKPNADLFFRIPGGYAIPPHSHTSAEHMVLVSGELDVHYQGRPATTMKAGDYAYGPPGLPHLGHCRSETPCTLFIAFEQPVDARPYAGQIAKLATVYSMF